MSVECLIAFLAHLVFLYMLLRLWRTIETNAGYTLTDFVKEYDQAADWNNRFSAFFKYSPLFLRYLLGTGFVTLAGSGFACLAAICGGWNAEMLKVVRNILLDGYEFISELITGKSRPK